MSKELMLALDEIEREKGIQKSVILDALSKALEKSYEKNFDDNTNVEVEINETTGDISVYALKDVVEEVEDKMTQISLEEAHLQRKTIKVGDVLRVKVKPKNFGRIAAQTARNIVIQKFRDAERESIYEEYIEREHEIITGNVQRLDYNNIYVNLGKTEGMVPPNEQIPYEKPEIGQRLKFYVSEVRNTTKGPQIILSRSNPDLVKRLFEQEVPEIADGTVDIFAVAREAGSRTKIAVYSNDPNVDPIGACVGFKGSRVNIIVEELHGEKMDIIVWNSDIRYFISNALSPSHVDKVIVNEKEKAATVIVPDDQLSLAIGKEGQNVRLAAKLTGWKIDIKGETQYEENRAYYDELEFGPLEEDGFAPYLAEAMGDEEEVEEFTDEDLAATADAVADAPLPVEGELPLEDALLSDETIVSEEVVPEEEVADEARNDEALVEEELVDEAQSTPEDESDL